MLDFVRELLEKLKGGANTKPKPPMCETPEPIQPVINNELIWMTKAFNEIGTHELTGGENKRIIEYHAMTTLKASEDEVPWCAAFVCWVLENCGIDSTNSAAANSYLKWGEMLPEPKYGAIVVLDRGWGKCHVGFVDDWGNGKIRVLGGNQDDQVTFKNFPIDKVLAYRWPTDFIARS